MKKQTLSDKRGQFEDLEGYFLEENVKQFIKEILDLLDDDINEREKYLAEQIKKKAGEELIKRNHQKLTKKKKCLKEL